MTSPSQALENPSQHPTGAPSKRSPQLPDIEDDEPLTEVIRKLSLHIIGIIDTPHTSEQLRSLAVRHELESLVAALAEGVHHPAIVTALLLASTTLSKKDHRLKRKTRILKGQFAALESDDRGLHESRGSACEIVAWRLLAHFSEHEVIDQLLCDLSPPTSTVNEASDTEAGLIDGTARDNGVIQAPVDEHTRLLSCQSSPDCQHSEFARFDSSLGTYRTDGATPPILDEEDIISSFNGLNALEIAAVAEAKDFLSQRVVQKIVNGIWYGEIVFWESLSVHTKKKAQLYNERRADPYCRLRVPKYQKIFEALFFVSFLALYYAVSAERNPRGITLIEALLGIWIAGFAYDEFGEFKDAGTLFYAIDFWSLWDLGIIGVGAAYLITRVIGLLQDSDQIIGISFDILSLEALFLVPRTCSLLSLNAYFGTLIPCLKEMTKDFLRFLGVVIILYIGFLTTFTLLARDSFTLSEMSWVLIQVFLGSSYLGFDIAHKISGSLGRPLMLIFVCMTNILLITSLISLLSNSLTKVMGQAKKEYLFQYSIFVLEASASRRLTYFLPPLNLIPLVTHSPFVAAIWLYEIGNGYITRRRANSQKRPFLSSQNSHPPVLLRKATFRNAALRSGPSLVATPMIHTKKSTTRQVASAAKTENTIAELKQMIEKLSSQVQELNASVARRTDEG